MKNFLKGILIGSVLSTCIAIGYAMGLSISDVNWYKHKYESERKFSAIAWESFLVSNLNKCFSSKDDVVYKVEVNMGQFIPSENGGIVVCTLNRYCDDNNKYKCVTSKKCNSWLLTGRDLYMFMGAKEFLETVECYKD